MTERVALTEESIVDLSEKLDDLIVGMFDSDVTFAVILFDGHEGVNYASNTGSDYVKRAMKKIMEEWKFNEREVLASTKH